MEDTTAIHLSDLLRGLQELQDVIGRLQDDNAVLTARNGQLLKQLAQTERPEMVNLRKANNALFSDNKTLMRRIDDQRAGFAVQKEGLEREIEKMRREVVRANYQQVLYDARHEVEAETLALKEEVAALKRERVLIKEGLTNYVRAQRDLLDEQDEVYNDTYDSQNQLLGAISSLEKAIP